MLLALTFQSVADQLKDPLVIFGFFGQAVFMGRFVLQWYASERRGESHIPIAFWYISIAGAVLLLIYSWKRDDPVFATGQALGLAIYVRNLMLIYRQRRRIRAAATLSAESDKWIEQPDSPHTAKPPQTTASPSAT